MCVDDLRPDLEIIMGELGCGDLIYELREQFARVRPGAVVRVVGRLAERGPGLRRLLTMAGQTSLDRLEPAAVLEAGDLDCGSGLVLLIREAMAGVPETAVLEMTSREPTVRDELPPWCGMVGHAYLGELPGEGCTRYFIRRGSGVQAVDERCRLETDKTDAKTYEWRTRVRHSGHLQATVYCRNFTFKVGQAASFEERDARPSAVEYVLGALGGSLAVAFATERARRNLDVDDVELRRDSFYSFVTDKLDGTRLHSLADLLETVEDKGAFEEILHTLDVPASAIHNPTCVGRLSRREPLAVDEMRVPSSSTRPI